MMLRDYQTELLELALESSDDVLIQLDTGAGKTRIMTAMARRFRSALLLAHRNILVMQLSGQLSTDGLIHRVIASSGVRKAAGVKSGGLVGRGDHYAASVDTLESYRKRGTLAIDPDAIFIDEAHHAIFSNKWGRVRTEFPNARVFGFTATPARLDGMPLKKGNGGIFDRLLTSKIVGPASVKYHISRGTMCDFRYYAGASIVDSQKLVIGETGEYTQNSMTAALKKGAQHSYPVAEYKEKAAGTQAVAMCVRIENAKELSATFRESGISSACIESTMGQAAVRRTLDDFAQKRFNVLTVCDMLSEGVDIPTLETLIIARPTNSLVSFRQWCGRALRPGKEYARIIDNAGNCFKHGLPDREIEWSIDRQLLTPRTHCALSCVECGRVIEPMHPFCPHCGDISDVERQLGIVGNYVEITTLERKLLLVQRAEYVAKIARSEAQKIAMQTTLLEPPQIQFGTMPFNSAINAALSTIRKKILQLYANVNGFESANDAALRLPSNVDFWLDRFKASDMSNDEKLMKFAGAI